MSAGEMVWPVRPLLCKRDPDSITRTHVNVEGEAQL